MKSEMAEKIRFSTDFASPPLICLPCSLLSQLERRRRYKRATMSNDFPSLTPPLQSLLFLLPLIPIQNHALRNPLHLAPRLSLRPSHSCRVFGLSSTRYNTDGSSSDASSTSSNSRRSRRGGYNLSLSCLTSPRCRAPTRRLRRLPYT